ncbi:MAG TPA: glycosyltransferase, partial [Solirubrobacterales bacterium]|nr:glycosyltransferase [Solirubrobacterales bacterium]
MTTLAAIVFWVCALAIVYAQVGYPFVLTGLVSMRRGRENLGGPRAPRRLGLARGAVPGAPVPERPMVSLIVPAFDEEDVIADKVANALRLDWPRERLQIIVADDGSTDATPERAREELAAAARAAAAGPYSWDEAARLTLALYEELLAGETGAPA